MQNYINLKSTNSPRSDNSDWLKVGYPLKSKVTHLDPVKTAVTHQLLFRNSEICHAVFISLWQTRQTDANPTLLQKDGLTEKKDYYIQSFQVPNWIQNIMSFLPNDLLKSN